MTKDITCNKSEKIFTKALSVAALAGLSFLGAQANAADYEPTLGEDSGYTLTPVDSETAGTNVINIPQYNETAQTVEDKYYQLDLTKTQYGDPDGDTNKTITTKAPNDYELNVKVNTNYGDQTNTATATQSVNALGGYNLNYKYKNIYGDPNGDTTANYHIDALGGMDYVVKFNTTYGEGDTTWTSSPVTILGNEYAINAIYDSNRVLSRIDNTTTRDAIDGVFVGGSGQNKGGGIYNTGTITTLTGDFINNTANYDD